MSYLSLVFANKKLKALIYLFLPYLITLISVSILMISNPMTMRSTYLAGFIYFISYEIIQPIFIIIYIDKYIRSKNLFFIFYFLFFYFFIFLFFYVNIFFYDVYFTKTTLIGSSVLYFKDHSMIIFDITSFLFFIAFIFYAFKIKKEILRYSFAFLTVSSHIFLNIYIINHGSLLDKMIFMIFEINMQYYLQGLFWIPLSFAIIQLLIEAYNFYKK